MRANRLRWLSLMGLLGLLSIPFRDSGFAGFFGFFGFMEFRKADERDEANIGRAAWLTFMINTIGFCLLILTVGLCMRYLRGQPGAAATLAVITATGVAVLYFVHLVVFLAAYAYYDRKGA